MAVVSNLCEFSKQNWPKAINVHEIKRVTSQGACCTQHQGIHALPAPRWAPCDRVSFSTAISLILINDLSYAWANIGPITTLQQM